MEKADKKPTGLSNKYGKKLNDDKQKLNSNKSECC
jgi:hypothetical protein